VKFRQVCMCVDAPSQVQVFYSPPFALSLLHPTTSSATRQPLHKYTYLSQTTNKPRRVPPTHTLQSLATMSAGPVFNDQVDKLLLSEIISFVGFGSLPDDMWTVVADLMGGNDAGYTADVVL
jgi:hypothetical protein